MPKCENVIKLSGEKFELDRHTLIFTHIPKCGGTSLHKTFETLLGAARYRVFVGVANHEEDLSPLRGGGGHQRFGNNPLHFQRKDLVYTTVLREPFEQFRSYYFHLQRDSNHVLRLKDPDIVNLSPTHLIRYLSSIDNRSAENLQSLMLAPRARTISEIIDHVESNYSSVGVIEYYSRYLENISSMFGISAPEFHLNTARENSEDIFDDIFKSEFYEKNQLDLALYNYYCRKF